MFEVIVVVLLLNINLLLHLQLRQAKKNRVVAKKVEELLQRGRIEVADLNESLKSVAVS